MDKVRVTSPPEKLLKIFQYGVWILIGLVVLVFAIMCALVVVGIVAFLAAWVMSLFA